MRNKLKFIFLILSFLIGVFAGSRIIYGILLFIVFSGAVFLLTKKLKTIIYLIIMFLFGFARFYFSFDTDDPKNLMYFNDLDEKVKLHGMVSEEPDIRSTAVKLTISVDTLEVDAKTFDVRGKVLLNLPRYPEYAYGDELSVRGHLETPAEDENFSYKNYLARYDVYSVMGRPYIELISTGNGNFFYTSIYSFKARFSNLLNKIFSEPAASFLAGLLLGSRKGIPDYIMEDFNATGLTHIIAISGYNITLLIVIVSAVFGFLGRRGKVIAASLVIITFTILVGASAACVRASVMGIISLFALFWGRKGDLDLVLLFAAAFMTMWNPKIFIFDVGFQLSFLATMGLVYISPFLTESRAFKLLPKGFGIRESFVMTLSAQALALPVILLNFQRLSIVSPFANVFVLPFIPISMLFGFLAIVSYTIFEPLGLFVSYVAMFFLNLMVWIAGIFAKVPFASYEVTWFSEILFVFYYLFVGMLLFKLYVFPSRTP
ncbi:MAG: ComEC/Rec2 family competence protein [Patescibacteria group bacterium]|nr:competence protein ComEC family protein [Patescibacteria group bacterium]